MEAILNMRFKKSKFLPLIIFIGVSGILTSCNQETNTGFDGKSYDISSGQDNSLLAKLDKVSGGYKITLSGTGKSEDFSEENKVPWYSILPKIKEVEIKDGVSGLGDNVFSNIDLTYYYLPASLTTISETSFKEGETLYSYADNVSNSENFDIYYYSETMPTSKDKKYWHFVNNSPIAWIIEHMNALFVGNSFTFYNDMPKIAESIAKDLGYDLTCDSVTVGSHTLEQYADVTDEYGKILDDKLKSSTVYNFVILQEQSTRSYTHFDSFEKGVSDLVSKIHSTQENAEISLYETWGFEEEANAKQWTVPQMEDEICAKYEEVGKKYNLPIHYVGEAFSQVYENHKEINLYADDNKHPSYEGSYLSALVHIGTMFNCDVTSTAFNGELSEETANTLKAVASNVVF